jgi:hypothetical protein
MLKLTDLLSWLRLDGCLGVEPRGMGSLLLKASATWGGIILPEGLRDWGRRAVSPIFSHTLAFAIQLRKSTENLSQSRH